MQLKKKHIKGEFIGRVIRVICLVHKILNTDLSYQGNCAVIFPKSILAPGIFSFFFNIVKQFLDDYTLSKINLYNSNQTKWLPAVLERIDASVLPKYYGGQLTDPDGNPKCVGKICWGGES